MDVRRAKLSQRLLSRRLLLLAGAGAAVACSSPNRGSGSSAGGSPTSPAGSIALRNGGTLTVAQQTNPPTFDPQRTTSFYTKGPSGASMSRLLRFQTALDPQVNENRVTEGDLAVSAESADAITWTVKLRPGARFQNVAPVSGRAVDAEDVRTTFVRALGRENPNSGNLDMLDAAQIQAPSADTVVFTLKYPYAQFPTLLASPTYSWILPREAAGGYDPAKQLIGSGPFILDNYTPDVALVYKKNPDWFGGPLPHVDGLRWTITSDSSQMRAQFTATHLDIIGGRTNSPGIAIRDLDALKRDNPKAQVIKLPPQAGTAIFFQLGSPSATFQDIRLRQAFSMAIDRDTLSKVIYNDDAEQQFYVHLDLGKWALRPSDLSAETRKYYTYNPTDAKKLIEAAGAADRSFKLVWVTGFMGPDYETGAQTVTNMLTQAGIKITAVSVDYQKDYVAGGKGIRNGNYDQNTIVFTGISTYEDADGYLYSYFSSKGSGPSKLNDPQLDTMLSKSRAILDDDQRLKAYLDVQRYIADKVYVVGAFPQPHAYVLVQPRVQSYQSSETYGIATEAFTKLGLAG